MAVDGKHHPLETTFHLIILKVSFYQRLNDRARVKREFRKSRDFCEPVLIHHGFYYFCRQLKHTSIPFLWLQDNTFAFCPRLSFWILVFCLLGCLLLPRCRHCQVLYETSVVQLWNLLAKPKPKSCDYWFSSWIKLIHLDPPFLSATWFLHETSVLQYTTYGTTVRSRTRTSKKSWRICHFYHEVVLPKP